MCLFLLTKLVKKVPGIVKLGDQKCYHFYVTKYSKTEKEELLGIRSTIDEYAEESSEK